MNGEDSALTEKRSKALCPLLQLRKDPSLTLNQYWAGYRRVYLGSDGEGHRAGGDARTLLTIPQSRLPASVALIQALGGDWDAASLGTGRVRRRSLPQAWVRSIEFQTNGNQL